MRGFLIRILTLGRNVKLQASD